MGKILRFKRNATSGQIPTAGLLSSGEPCTNSGDNILFIKMATSVRSFRADSIYSKKTSSFTAEFGYLYDLHNTANLTITLPTWIQGRYFEVTLDGDAKNHTLTFSYPTGEPINGVSADKVAGTKDIGDVFIVRAMGESTSKHWSIVRQVGI